MVQKTEIVTIKEAEVVRDHNQVISLEAEEEAIIARRTTIILTERMTPIARTMITMMGTAHPNPRSSVLPRILGWNKRIRESSL